MTGNIPPTPHQPHISLIAYDLLRKRRLVDIVLCVFFSCIYGYGMHAVNFHIFYFWEFCIRSNFWQYESVLQLQTNLVAHTQIRTEASEGIPTPQTLHPLLFISSSYRATSI
jgi:hypothetical protein